MSDHADGWSGIVMPPLRGGDKKAGGISSPGFSLQFGFQLFAHKNVDVGFMDHTHQTCIFGLDDLVMMIG